MATPDGSVVIDTKINTKTFNTGIKGLSGSFDGVIGTVKKLGKALSTAFLGGSNVFAIIKNLAKFAAAAFIGGSIINSIRGIADSFDLMSSSVGEQIKPLSTALETLKGTFVNLIVQAFIPMIPYIVMIVQWLTNMLQIVTQVVAALFGFESTVGNIMTKAAAGAKKTAKEAKGALAAFDQINVLQKQEQPETPEGATATPGPLAIDPKIQAFVDELLRKFDVLKKILATLFDNPLKIFSVLETLWKAFVDWVRNNLPFGNVIADILTIVGDTFKKMFVNFIETVLKVKENILMVFQGIKDFLTGVFTGDWKLAWEGLKEIVGGVFGAIFALFEGIANHFRIAFEGMMQILQVVFAPVLEWLQEMFGKIRTKISEAITSVQATFANLSKWFLENVWTPIESGFGSMLTGLRLGFEKTFNGIKTFIKGVINGIIDFINGMIEGIVFGINSVIGAANAVGELVGAPEIGYVDAPKIPKLATGAVIPPNAQFAAILGDQKSGRNIEAPEDLIRQIVREETGKMQAEITIRFEGNLAQLVRELKPHIDRENVRVGGSLIKSGTTV